MECEPRGLLTRNVLDRLGRRFHRLRGGRALQREDDLADFHLVAFFYAYFLHHAAHRRRHFDDGFVGFQFHHGLAFGDFGAGRNHQAHQIALIDVFAKFRKLEFRHRTRARSGRRCFVPLDWRGSRRGLLG